MSILLAANKCIPNVIVAGSLTMRARPDVQVGRLPKQRGFARFVFVSRIARMKNLDYAISLLSGMTGSAELDIYGPIEDEAYWRECQVLASRASQNVHITYCGVARPDEVPTIFAGAHGFLFPTRGENHGHVIIEALAAGCPVIVSDRTPWRGLSKLRAGWDLPLSQEDRFREALAELVNMDQQEFDAWSLGAREFVSSAVQREKALEENRLLFTQLLDAN